MTFLSKLSSVSSITSFLSPPPLSLLCEKQTDPHISSSQNGFPTQALPPHAAPSALWVRYKPGSVRSYNFPILELTTNIRSLFPWHFEETARKSSIKNSFWVKLTNRNMWERFPSSSCPDQSKNEGLSSTTHLGHLCALLSVQKMPVGHTPHGAAHPNLVSGQPEDVKRLTPWFRNCRMSKKCFNLTSGRNPARQLQQNITKFKNKQKKNPLA